MTPVFVAAAVVALVVAAWLIARSLDVGRIDAYLRGRGCRLLQFRWTPFGKGWLGEGSERIYAVRFRDRDGAVHAATIKTSLLTGVYFTDDRVVERARAAVPAAMATELLRENERLRAEVEQLRRGG
jgi:hypothetical protein